MPRANRYVEPGHTLHIAHRCPDLSFLFRFVIDRQTYRTLLRERLGSFGISLLHDCITSKLNMVRAGVVSHPGEWEWTDYRELMGMRKRNRLEVNDEQQPNQGDAWTIREPPATCSP